MIIDLAINCLTFIVQKGQICRQFIRLCQINKRVETCIEECIEPLEGGLLVETNGVFTS
jgi:hypothetical protein